MARISIVIPTFNRAELLRKAAASVLQQVGDDFEVVVSDNCSTDHTPDVLAELARDPRVVCSRNDRNLGMVGNWRKAIFELARGEWFMLMSDDDYLTDPGYLGKALAAIDAHDPAFVYSGGAVHDTATDRFIDLRLPFDGLVSGADVFASRGTVQPQDALLPTMLFRRADARRLGFLDDPDNLSCDSELYLKLCAEGTVFAVGGPACVYVKHGANLIYRIAHSRRLLDHNLDHLVKPFAYARQRGMAHGALDAYRRNARLETAIGSTLLRLWLHDEGWYGECRDRLAALLPDVLGDVEASAGYRAKRLVVAAGRPVLRRRYPLADAGAGTV